MTDLGYEIGDTIILTVEKPCTFYQASEASNETWPKGTKLVITNVYHDGDVYAKNDKGISRMIRKEEFETVKIDLSNVTIGNITIHDNINGELIARHYERIEKDKKKQQEEEEKKREEYYRLYGTRYPTQYQLHPELYNNPSSSSDYFNMRFYEWSEIYDSPRIFTSRKEFLKFIADSKIEVSDEDKRQINYNSGLYAICAKNTSTLLLSNTFFNLKKAFEEFKPKVEKFILTKTDNAYTYLRTVTYNKDGQLSGFTFGNKREDARIFDTKEKAEEAAKHVKERTANFIKLEVQTVYST